VRRGGLFQKPAAMLRAGDRVRIEIEHLGAIENQIVDEPLCKQM